MRITNIKTVKTTIENWILITFVVQLGWNEKTTKDSTLVEKIRFFKDHTRLSLVSRLQPQIELVSITRSVFSLKIQVKKQINLASILVTIISACNIGNSTFGLY